MIPKYSFLSNSCLSVLLYAEYNKNVNKHFIDYTNPFVSCWFPDDEAYVRLCENYEYYTSIEPRFDNPINKNWENDTKCKRHLAVDNYLVMFLGDIEIHWIHDTNPSLLLQKFKGRLKNSEGCELIFLWSDSEMFNKHTKEERKNLMKRFNASKHKTIFLTKFPEEEYQDETTIVRFIPEWKEKSHDDRSSWFLLTWYDNPQTTFKYKKEIDNFEKI